MPTRSSVSSGQLTTRLCGPQDAAALGERHLDLPEPTWNGSEFVHGWGEFHLDEAIPHVGARCTDGGKPQDHRQLKSRAAGEGRRCRVRRT
jgi:hypothetical protein